MNELLEKKRVIAYLQIDAEKEIEKIKHLLEHEIKRLRKRGVVIGLSGGLDSSVCAYLCVRVLGRKKVHIFILPERDSGAQNIQDAEKVAQDLGLTPTRIDITPLLEQLGVYRLISADLANNRPLIKSGIDWLTRLTRQPSPFSIGVSHIYGTGQDKNKVINRLFGKSIEMIQTFAITKVRVRMIVLYYYAMLNNCLLIGTTDKSEWQIGFYDKYGDGANDLALLCHLYKTQIRELAKHLGIDSKIINKPSSGDLAANLPNEEVIGLTYPQLDFILWGIEHELSDQEMIYQAGVTHDQLEAVRKLMRIAQLRERLPSHL